MKINRWMCCLLAVVGSLLASTSPGVSAERKVVLLMYSPAPDIGDAPLWMVPHALGYFADEGLRVDIAYSKGSNFAIQLLASGKGDFGTSTPESAMIGRQKGVKLKSVFEHNRSYGSALVVPKSSGITRQDQLKDYLKGSAIGVLSLSSGRIPYARAWLQELGLKEGTDVNLVEVGVGAQAATAMKTGRVKALVIYDAVYAAIEATTDVKFTRFEADWQRPFFSGVILAMDTTIQNDPDLIVRFDRAVAKALVFSTTNPEAVVRIYWELYPENKPAPDKEQSELKKLVVIADSMLPNWGKGMSSPGAKWGSQDRSDWEKLQDFASKVGLIPGKLPVDEYFTDQFNSRANQFDVEAIRRQAREFTLNMVKERNTR